MLAFSPLAALAQNVTQTANFTPIAGFYPQYLGSGNTTRLPVMFRATMSGLTASTTYRYYAQGGISTDVGAANSGAGNPMLVDAAGTTFTYTTSPSLTTAGGYGSFTTDASGNYTGWFGFVYTSNARFTAGNAVFPIITIAGNTGTPILYRWAPTAGSGTILCLAFSTSAGANNGTGIRGTSSATAKNFVTLHDNSAGTGRPLTVTYIESEGTSVASAAAYYGSAGSGPVDGIAGAWGTIVPNTLINGVRRIAQYNNAGTLVGGNIDSDGSWPTGPVNTVNPAGGSTALVISSSDAALNVTYTVTYNANSATSGSVPIDSSSPYAVGSTVMAADNSGSLARSGYTFANWNTQADGNGTTYTAGSGTFTINANTTLYAKWTAAATAPTVTSSAATSIGATTVTLNGNVTADGGASVTDRGFCYKTGSGVTISDNKTQSGTGTGAYTLSPVLGVNVQYFFKAYAINTAGTTLSTPELSFWTLANTPSAPTVNGATASSLNVAITSGDGNPSTTIYAIQETGSGNYVQAGGTLGVSAVYQTASTWGNKNVTGLSPSTSYTFKVKAQNGAGTDTPFGSATTLSTTASLSVPTLTTPTATGIGETTATLGATITSDGNASITARGTVWGTSPAPAGNILSEGGTSMGVFAHARSSLPAGTTITFRGYAINSQGTAYSPDGTFCTLSTEPSTHAGSFTATAASGTAINLSWSVASGANGYLILKRTGGSAPTGVPSDASGYSVGNTIGDGTVAAIVTPGSATGASLSGLTANTQYSFAIIPFSSNGTDSASLNYRTSATIPTAMAGTLAQVSDIVADSGFTYPQSIAYGSYQETDLTSSSLAVAQFTMRDGGASADADSAGTTLNSISFTVTGSSALRRVALYDGTTELGEVAAGGTITFGSLNVTAPDGGTKTLTLRASFTNAVTDNQQFSFTVSSATADSAGSTFATADAGAAASSTSGNNNKIAVTATRLAFTTAPSSVSVGSSFIAAVQAQDANSNADVDSTASVTMTKASGSGTLSAAGGLTKLLVAGTNLWSDLQLDTAGTFTISATNSSLTAAVSDNITAVSVPPLSDNFNRATLNGGTYAYTTTSSTGGGGAMIASSTMLQLTNGTPAGWTSVAMTPAIANGFNSVLDSCSGLVTWTFNMRFARTGGTPSGFTSANYGNGFVLASDNNDFSIAGSKGYAVLFGNTSSPDTFRLVAFNNGIKADYTTAGSTAGSALVIGSGAFSVSTQAAANDYYSFKVTYDPATKLWTFYGRDDGSSAFADPASGSYTMIGTFTESSAIYRATALGKVGAYWSYSTSAGNNSQFDNFNLNVAAAPSISGAATASAFTTTYGSSSASQSFPVSGANLTADITATAPTGFEVSTNDATYGATATFPQTGGSAGGMLYVRLATNATVGGSYNSQNISLVSGTASTNIVTSSSGNAVTAKALGITATAQSKTYGSTLTLGVNQSAFTAAGLTNGETVGTVTLTADGGTNATATPTSYTITPSTVVGGTFNAANYSISYNTGTLTVNKATPTVTITDAGTFTQDGNPHGPVSASAPAVNGGVAPSGTYTWSYSGSGYGPSAVPPTLAGSYTAVATITADANYNGASSPSTPFTINATPTIAAVGTLSAVNTTYGTASASPTVFTVSGSALGEGILVSAPSGYEVSLVSGAGYAASLTVGSAGSVAATNVYVRLAVATAVGNYAGNVVCSSVGAVAQTVATVSSTVAQKGLTITGLSGVNKVYDQGTNATLTGTAALSGVVAGDESNATLGGTPAAFFATTTVASNKAIAVSGYALSGSASGNYSLTQPVGLTAHITARNLTVSGVAVTTKPYDGTATAAISGSLVGVLSPDSVTLTGGGTFADVNAASGINVTANLSLSGAQAGNYSLTQPTGLTGNITKANQTITFNAIPSKAQTDPAFDPGATADSGLTVSYASSNASVAIISNNLVVPVGAGTSVITAMQAGDGNHNAATPANQTLTVAAGPTTLAAGDLAIIAFGPTTLDKFAVVLLRDIGMNTVINFTDNGFDSATAGRLGEGFLTYTAPAAQPAGTVITWSNGQSLPGTGWNSAAPNNFAFNASGDQLFAFQGLTNNWVSQTGITLLYGLQTKATWLVSGTAAAGTSYAPATSLLASAYLVQFPSFSDVYLTATTLSGTAAQIITSVTTTGNYTQANSAFSMPAYTTFTINAHAPTLYGAATASAFTTTYGTPSAAQTFTIGGSNLTADITATAPAGFEVSSNGATYGSTVTYAQSGGSAGGTLSVRLTATATPGNYNSLSNVLSSAGATPVAIASSGSGNTVGTKNLTVSGASVTTKTYDGTTNAAITGATLVGIVGTDAVTVSGGGYFDSPDVGASIPVTAALALGGANAGYYTLTQPAGLSGVINKANQSITFGALAGKVISDAPFALTATASSGLMVSYSSSDSGVASVSGNTVTILALGTTTVTASQAGNGNWNAATSVPQNLTVASVPAFTPGNLVVEIVGDGSALSNTAMPVAIQEFTTTGTAQSPVQTIAMPQVGSLPAGNPFNLLESGTATSDGFITRSSDARVLCIPGYNGTPGEAGIVVSSEKRVIGTLTSAGGTPDTSRGITAYGGNNFRSVASVDGTAFWCGGPDGVAPMGIVYYNGVSISTLNAGCNGRTIRIINNTLYFSSGASGNPSIGVHQLGLSGTLPTSGPQTSTAILTNSNLTSPYGFDINPEGTIAYVADDNAVNGGVYRFDKSGNSWTMTYRLNTTQARGLIVDWSASPAVVYVTDAAVVSANNILKITDNGAGSSATTLATASANHVFRGLAFTPLAVSPSTITGAATASAFTTTYGTASLAQNFPVSGANLSGNITANAPSGFEVSIDGSTYGATATFAQAGGTASGTLWIRLATNAPVSGSYNQKNIVLMSPGATSVNVTTADSGNMVNRKALTVTGASVTTRPYDGTMAAGITGATLVGVVGSDVVTVSGGGTFASPDPGTGIAVTASLVLGGANAGNYTLVQPLGLTGTIISTTSYFTAGNLAVLRADAITNNTTCTIIELSPFIANQTVPVSSNAISGTGSGALRISGSATSVGYLSHSADGTLLTFTGVNTNETTTNVNALNPRCVGTFDFNRNFAIKTTYTGSSGNQTRSATSLNNTTWFIGDQGGLYSNGTSAGDPSTVSSRGIKTFGGTVYVLQQSSSAGTIVISTVSAAVGGTVSGLSGMANDSAAADFYFLSSGNNGSAYDVLYIVGTSTIKKYSLYGSSWTANGSYTLTGSGFGICAAKTGGGVDLYVTSGGGATAANSVLKFTDSAGYNATISLSAPTTLYTAPAGTTLKGIDFVPINKVTITSPTNNAGFVGGASIPIMAAVSDPNGSVTNVAFYVDNNLLGNRTSPTDGVYGGWWRDAEVGEHSLTAVACDNNGLCATSAVVHITVIKLEGSVYSIR